MSMFTQPKPQSPTDPPVDDQSAAEVIPVVPETPAPRRFCGTCGETWQPHWTICENCEVRSQQNPVALDVTTENRALKSAIALYFALLGVCAIGILNSAPDKALAVQFGVTIGLSAVTLIWCALSWRTVLPTLGRSTQPRWFATSLGLALVTFLIATGVIGGLSHLMQWQRQDMSDPFRDAGYGWAMIVLCICVQPALIEELAFRGVILGALEKALSPFEAVMVSALMFMTLHLSVARFPHTLALGLAAGFLRLRTRSLYPCILLHFSHNLLCVLTEAATH